MNKRVVISSISISFLLLFGTLFYLQKTHPVPITPPNILPTPTITYIWPTQPVPTPTKYPLSKIKMTGWKTYQNESYTYRYPSEWNSKNGDQVSYFTVKVNGNNGLIWDDCGDLISTKPINISGINTQIETYSRANCYDDTDYSFIISSVNLNSNNYFLLYFYPKKYESMGLKIFEQIANSFKVL